VSVGGVLLLQVVFVHVQAYGCIKYFLCNINYISLL